jgi:hypothetical protein
LRTLEHGDRAFARTFAVFENSVLAGMAAFAGKIAGWTKKSTLARQLLP